MFIQIHENYPKQAQSYYHVVEDIIIEKKRYDICAVDITDPISNYKHIEKLHKLNVNFSKESEFSKGEEFERFTEETYTKGVCRLVQ